MNSISTNQYLQMEIRDIFQGWKIMEKADDDLYSRIISYWFVSRSLFQFLVKR